MTSDSRPSASMSQLTRLVLPVPASPVEEDSVSLPDRRRERLQQRSVRLAEPQPSGIGRRAKWGVAQPVVRQVSVRVG